MKFEVYQVSRKEPNLASTVMFYGLSASYTQVEARQAFNAKKYTRMAIIEANSNEHVENLVNKTPENKLIKRELELRQITIGDIIKNISTNQAFIRSTTGWDRIKL